MPEPWTPEEYRRASEYAARKLEWIISLEGDADGERRKPYYMAQLIAEAIAAERLSKQLSRNEDKKRTARAEAQGNSQIQPHYSMALCGMQ